MTHIKHGVSAPIVIGFILSAALAGAQGRHEPTVGSSVTLAACVENAQEGDKFVLTHVADMPNHPPTKGGRVVYWIDKVDQLRPHVGHQIRLMGKITDTKKDEIEVKLGEDGKGGAVVEIEGPHGEVKATPKQANVSTAGQVVKEKEIPTTVVKLQIEKVEMVAAACNLK
ncbi:MAG TPA: hypothetical protein VEK56_16625 [Vicinamibacterales bacterium]|nr:hypothetical protein [Vicinamibacterales bacterium]